MRISNGGISAVSKDEKLLANVQRHPAGLIIIYVQVLIGLLAAVAVIFFAWPTLTSSSNAIPTFLTAALFLIGVLALVLLVVITQIYRQNHLIITDKNVTQVFQRSLFDRQVSELSMANVEDVTAEQKGILAHMFGYGELRVETAGEQDNFHFIYCPNPDYYGKMILDGRQQFLRDSAQR